MSGGKAVLIQFDWDRMRVVSTQVIEQNSPEHDVIAEAESLRDSVKATARNSEFAILANAEAASGQRVASVTMMHEHPARAQLAARQNPWAAERMAD